jgi:hypothetical protein
VSVSNLIIGGPPASRELRAPREDGAVLAEPPLGAVGSWLHVNRLRLQRTDQTVLGRSWSDLQRQSRREAIAAARHYLTARGEPTPEGGTDRLIMAGHQPELFHTGVWVKNFALHGLARRHDLTPINLLVDNDTVKSSAMRLPAPATGTVPPHLTSVAFDRWTEQVPFEERRVQDRPLFDGFAERATEVLRGWDYSPMLGEFWDEVRRRTERTALLGECFAAARRTFERAWGCHNLELPVSALSRTESFAWFACHLLADLPRFHAVYNESVHEYRHLHGIRNRSHPVPDLAASEGWLEAPFWGWRSGQARRGRLFARLDGGRLALRAGSDTWPALPSPAASGAAAVAAWAELEAAGCKVRPRALTNTLFARLFLCDLFIHGIGGGKYDELTDTILRRFYGGDAPSYLVLSATRLLPLPVAAIRPEDCRRLAHTVRDVHYNPQRHLEEAHIDPAPLRELLEQKRAWIARQPERPAERRQRFEVLRRLTDRLREPLADRETELRRSLAGCEQQLETRAVLQRRDYAFCLYPEALLRPFCTQFL